MPIPRRPAASVAPSLLVPGLEVVRGRGSPGQGAARGGVVHSRGATGRRVSLRLTVERRLKKISKMKLLKLGKIKT